MAGVLLPLSLGACAWFEGDSLVGGPAGSLEPPTDYLIGPEDVVVISVWKEEGLEQEVIVRPDGKLSFPLAGDVAAAGRTPEQVQRDIATKIERYIPDPVVTVSVKEIGGGRNKGKQHGEAGERRAGNPPEARRPPKGPRPGPAVSALALARHSCRSVQPRRTCNRRRRAIDTRVVPKGYDASDGSRTPRIIAEDGLW
jgi:hypothetical protein